MRIFDVVPVKVFIHLRLAKILLPTKHKGFTTPEIACRSSLLGSYSANDFVKELADDVGLSAGVFLAYVSVKRLRQ